MLSQEANITSRLELVGKGMLSLSNGERQLALGYVKNHKDISKMIIANIFDSLGVPMIELDRIACVARVPGRRIAIVIYGQEDLPCNISDLAKKLGNEEIINIIKLNKDQEKEIQISFLLKYFDIQIEPLVEEVNEGKQTIVYLSNQDFSQEQLDSIDLIQQILNIHIILK